MSCLVTRPPSPVPGNLRDVDLVLARDPADERRRLAGGRVDRRSPAVAEAGRRRRVRRAGADGPQAAIGLRLRRRRGLGGAGPRRGRAAAPAAAPRLRPESTPTTELTETVSPSLTVISVRMPAAGDGISASTLSVVISKSGSSRSTWSPTFLIQRTIVPSAIDSPIWGMTMGVGMATCGSPRRARRARLRRPPRRTSGARGSS